MIRRANINDLQQIIDLENKYLSPSFGSEMLEKDLNDHIFTILVEERDNKIVGLIYAYLLGATGEILKLTVLEEYRNQGIATSLINELKIIDKQLKELTLEVRESNIKAHNLYLKNGFEDISIRKNYYSNGEDAIVMKKKLITILSIETSCDETAMAIVVNGKQVIANYVYTQISIHTLYGGVVPEIASREHIKKITYVLDTVLKESNYQMEDIDYIAVTSHPGLMGSLMVGINCAKTLALVYNKPLIMVNHIYGHIYANYLEDDFSFPLLALVVSGGHTELVLMKDHYDFEVLGETLDDAVGESYDKVARVVDVGYPGGPIIDKMASLGEPSYKLPRPNPGDYNFSFSGLKSAVINLYHNEQMKGNEINKDDLAASFQQSVIDILTEKTILAAKEYKVKQVIIAGGVAANKGLRQYLGEEVTKLGIKFTIPSFKYCTDNAAMIASAAYNQLKHDNK